MPCELVPLPQSYSGAFWTKAPPTPLPLMLDIGMQDAIRVIDRNTNALVASAPLTQVMATPAKYQHGGGDEAWHMDPLLIVAVPGFQPLSIRLAPMKYPMEYPRGTYRYSWREIDTVNRAEQPGYVVTEEDWLALTERFGPGQRSRGIPDHPNIAVGVGVGQWRHAGPGCMIAAVYGHQADAQSRGHQAGRRREGRRIERDPRPELRCGAELVE